MKFVIRLAIVSFIATAASAAFAADYKCQVPVTPELGFGQMDIRVSPTTMGGYIYGDQGRGEIAVAVVHEVNTYKKGDIQFRLMLNLFSGEIYSGINEHDINQVTSILEYKEAAIYKTASEVIRFFSGTKQVGGTFVLRGDAVACLPLP